MIYPITDQWQYYLLFRKLVFSPYMFEPTADAENDGGNGGNDDVECANSESNVCTFSRAGNLSCGGASLAMVFGGCRARTSRHGPLSGAHQERAFSTSGTAPGAKPKSGS
ncbi:uncharacterized protein LOC142557748 isoform X4 [Dermacentor variabilis]|uniref:uncharacterized protein LOC142557748 isoform X4 n=2 Tax=Dermacentor variabilis TaxID=34621 RepID=UPI003F5C2A91